MKKTKHPVPTLILMAGIILFILFLLYRGYSLESVTSIVFLILTGVLLMEERL